MTVTTANLPATLPREYAEWQMRSGDRSAPVLTASNPSDDREGRRQALRFTLEGELLLDSASFELMDRGRSPHVYDVAVETETVAGITPAARSAVAAYSVNIAIGNGIEVKLGQLIDEYV
jgi:hypothetical protein